jgi:hypothetical protein
MRLLLVALTASLFCACGDFDDPTIVYDMRVLGVIAEPPEILVPADPDMLDPSALPEVEVCALVADPGESRELSFTMAACPPTARGRCDDPRRPTVNLGSGTVPDPEESPTPGRICGTLGPSPTLAEIIESSISIDSLSGFGAIDIQIEIAIWPAGEDPSDAVVATKQMRFGAALPVERIPNSNPSLESIAGSRAPTGMRGLDFELPVGRCGDIDAPIVAPGESIGLLPIEPEGVREDYVVPTFDGESRSFTEILRYDFFATEGSYSKGQSGGERDISGTLPTLDTRWKAPSKTEIVGTGLDVSLFIIQRDERGGQSWIQSCVHVMP